MEHNLRSVTLAADTSSGQRADMELAEANVLWVSAGPGIEVADIWIKGVAGVIDLRVRILRLGSALEVAIDRGEQSVNWWPPDAAPRILVVLDQSHRIALATASVGRADEIKTVELGSVSY
jgi:hypothetical protein